MTTLFVCITCNGHGENPTPEQPRPGLRLLPALRANAETLGGWIAVNASDRVGALDPDHDAAGIDPDHDAAGIDPDHDAAGVVAFACLHDADAAGVSPWRQRRAHVGKRAFARVPPSSRLPPQPETAAR